MPRRCIALLASILLGCSDPPTETKLPSNTITMAELGSYDASGWHPPSGGLVAEAETAIQIARIYLSPLVPADWAANPANWVADAGDENQWVVGLYEPRCPPGTCLGGGWMIMIRKSDGAITGVYAGQ
jgi:hypothetical protein